MSKDLVETLNERAGCGLELIGIAPQGQSGGAAYVRWPDGRDSVVTTALAPIEHMRQTADVLGIVKQHGIPVPRHEFLWQLDDGLVAVVQERLPGLVVVESDASVVDAMVAMNERFAGLLVDRPDVPTPRLRLGGADDPVLGPEPMQEYSARSRRLLRLIQRIGAEVGVGDGFEMDGDDLVHVDLTVPNVLFDEAGQISGVIDWNYGIARGDRRFGLVKLLFDLTWASSAPGPEQRPKRDALDRVREIVHTTIEPSTLRTYWAHQTFNMLYWTIRSGNTDAIDIHLDLGESLLGTP